MNILFINDIDDITNKKITHFSLDKALYLAYGTATADHNVFFLTTGVAFTCNNVNFININDITSKFIDGLDLIIIVREALVPDVIKKIPALLDHLLEKKKSNKTKIMIKSDSTQWITKKHFIDFVAEYFGITCDIHSIVKWVVHYFDYICVQTNEFKNDALQMGIPEKQIIMSNMAVPNIVSDIDFNNLDNPYDILHSYCVDSSEKLGDSKALLPLYYCNNKNDIDQFNTKKKIIVYMGRIKTDSGKIFYMMRDIMKALPYEYELHIFPGSFVIPNGKSTMICSARNSNHLQLLREKVFADTKNVIIHYPCQHKDIYKYLHFAYCGIDFSEVRPSSKNISKAGHAKILEYCSVGIPIVCEENINNLFLIENANNGIVLPYMSSSNDYAKAIISIDGNFSNREQYRNITFKNENSIVRAKQLLDSL